MARSARPARPAAVAAGAAAASVLLLGACAPVTTELPYAPSDGTRVDFTDVEARGLNLMVLSPAEGSEGAVFGALANSSSEDLTFTLTATGAAPVTVTVPAQETVYLGTEEGEQVTLDSVATIPGGNLEATLTAGDDTEDFYLPVFDSTLPEYAAYVP
ncbi:hypothetical protein ATJ88_3103 [Isoptericola jiangsuensis]|uniref:DNA modification methylase n=1 Tax=Isoptericola jiangsuensis TaxID=548579 RepID=A0A2A9F1U6_9MICO|nr:hypothetical protein [Isoptericola jiangsuensis]PFG44379.1 hypothetical protein ATJ88_3103 [Isoptericola jiangsuensis]